MRTALLLLALWCSWAGAALYVRGAVTVDFASVDFIAPTSLLRNAATTACAPFARALVESAEAALRRAPWTVTDSPELPPNGDPHTYYSWADYFWPVPACNVSDPQFMRDCDFERRDGVVNPDTALCRQKSAANAVVGDAIALALASLLVNPANRSAYTAKAAQQLSAFFLEPATRMQPNLDYGQVIRGHNYLPWVGRAEGVIDVRAWAYLPTVLVVLDAQPPSPVWKAQSAALKEWLAAFSLWLTNSTIGRTEQSATNNHGTWHFVQTVTYAHSAGLQATAERLLRQYLSTQYEQQITANGSQPLELARTRPLHYSAFNLQALTYLAKFARQWGVDVWRTKNSNGATIQTAVDFLLRHYAPPFAEDPTDVVPLIVDVMNEYGDPTGRYAAALRTFNRGSTAPLFSSLWQTPPQNASRGACDEYGERTTARARAARGREERKREW